MNRSRRIVVVILAVLSVGGFAAMQSRTAPGYELTQGQRDQLNMSARTGRIGLMGFERTYEYPNGMSNRRRDKTEVQPVKVGGSFIAGRSLEQVAFENGAPPREDGEEMGEGSSFTPLITKSGVYVTHSRRFVNASTNVRKMVVQRNPNTLLFGDDGLVSVDEMLAFYNDPATELVSLKHDEDDILWECVVNLEFHGDTLRTDAADGCPRFIDDSSTDQLVADLVDRYVN